MPFSPMSQRYLHAQPLHFVRNHRCMTHTWLVIIKLSLYTVIAEEPEVKQLVLELKGQYSPEIIDMPEIKTNTVRRLSVNRSSQREKRAVTKQSTIEEASIMAEHVSTCGVGISLAWPLTLPAYCRV